MKKLLAVLSLAATLTGTAAFSDAVGISAAGFDVLNNSRIGVDNEGHITPRARPWIGSPYWTKNEYNGAYRQANNNMTTLRARTLRAGGCWSTCPAPKSVTLDLDIPDNSHLKWQGVIPSTNPNSNNGRSVFHYSDGSYEVRARPHDPTVDGYGAVDFNGNN